MKIKSIILNVLLIIILICLIYFFIYLNNSNFENFADDSNNTYNNLQKPVAVLNDTSNIVASETAIEIEDILFNGYSQDRPLKDAFFGFTIIDYTPTNSIFKPVYPDGYYWINIQDRGSKLIYCIMDKAYNGGGWMLAMRSLQGSTNFTYDSEHFKNATTFNDSSQYISDNIINGLNLREDDYRISSIGDQIYDNTSNLNICNKFDAKFDTFNYTKAYEWMAIFYVKDRDGVKKIGGDIPNNNRGWVWIEPYVKISSNNKNKLVSPLKFFNYLERNNIQRKLVDVYNKKYAQNLTKFTNNTNRRTPLSNIIFTSQPMSEGNTSFYGMNYSNSTRVTRMRWGFNFNDSNDDSNDAYGGIGGHDKSSGNFERNDTNARFSDRPVQELRNKSYAVEWYVREKR